MRKIKFNLQKVQFQSDSDQDHSITEYDLISQYTQINTSLRSHSQKFFKDCRNIIQRFTSLNHFGIGLNLPFLFMNFSNLNTESIFNQTKNTIAQQKTKIKSKYQKMLSQIVQKMNLLVQQLIQFQVSFKSEYFGNIFKANHYQITQKNKKIAKNNQAKLQLKEINQFDDSQDKFGCSKTTRLFENYVKCENRFQNIMNEKILPEKKLLEKFCKQELTIDENLDKINQKVDQMIKIMNFTKNKELNNHNIFNKKKNQNFVSTNRKMSLSKLKYFGDIDDFEKQEQNTFQDAFITINT